MAVGVGVGMMEDVVDDVVIEDKLELVAEDEIVVIIAEELEVDELVEVEVLEMLVILAKAVVVYTNVEFEKPTYLAPHTLVAALAVPTALFK